jgi:DegV family protein with EDD domain
MHIVTDSGADLIMTPEKRTKLNIHIVPLNVTLAGKTYREGIDIEKQDFYQLLENSQEMPVTSQPSAGDFGKLYRQLAETGKEILSIHISSGLSGTLNAARAGAELAPEANVTHFDSKTLSAATGWLVEAAGRAVKAGWSKDRILEMLERIRNTSNSIYTLKELKYLIHGGRISHMKGLIATALNIKPLIGVEKAKGIYEQMGQARTFKRAVRELANLITKQHEPGSALRVQVMHAFNPEGAEMLREHVDSLFECNWLPIGPMSLVLGAHTGPSMVGVAYAPESTFNNQA